MASQHNDLKGKKALITGGCHGIGYAIASELIEQNVDIVIADIDKSKADEAVNSLKQMSKGKVFSCHMDVSNPESVNSGFDEMFELFETFDFLIANAGVSTMNHATALTEEEWDFNFNVNAKGVFLTNQAAARHWIEQNKQGVIVNTASLAAKVGAPLLAHYSASKFAVLGWTQACAKEWAEYGIRVNAVCPGFVETGMQEREVQWEAKLRQMEPQDVINEYVQQTPLGRLEEPTDVSKVVAFLLSDASAFMTGQAVNVTGGVYMG
ncbi:putative 3-oxoacyl-(acyl-carrier-protein) reductase [Vibrio nigripulchritudo SFn27]|uniref:Putative 3-oxoacyl-[acyl-carrier-protein] reductase n=1 Tax=Vibrio nigripulchritudo TaxID=28173 RepID=U4KJ46_9VIBR|nr:SDR family NAD(P)-dependent oxidoreductase [Vibrio nigripulchritudo]CCN84003.1 putative 3-oxoacyl-(acyl-carrier-protein) reductase [Vibrio nigripulchritudo BLFn1]CCN89327.1 putative 3-oxoacyl-(acyl-carrier-protein) reductase [Vibrio nigripulchritudo SFn27]CCN93018.1 putative 3-oxoacyl-(acyl-carrier-protein) reductase [Vibrio nigripulchritudo ENn2]CCO40451.1 putative 3-oxoacyl-(acyl-carrier-protein) reductase [Vibrio nigripulchritudo SFn135]CCO55737.1 putative 3-oxoacyl-(acyl-carrier-protein